MIRGIYTTATGMMASEQRLDVIANNLANASTAGFRRDGVNFSEACEREMCADGGLGQSLGTLGSGPTATGQYTDFSPGPVTPTGNALDVAIDSPKAAFAVEVQQPNGTTQTYYTRDGSFTLNASRQLVDKAGYPVLDDSGRPITLPQGVANISADGTVSVDGKSVAKIGVYSGQFVKAANGLFTPAVGANGLPVDPQALSGTTLKTQCVEGSNVDTIKSMIDMITTNRSYELAQKSIQKQDDSTQKLIQSLQTQS